MYEIFGEFNSYEEINQAAAGLKAEGDNDNIITLAKENGIDEEFAQAYIEGEIPILVDAISAAVGKIELERKSIEEPFFNGIEDDMINYLLTACATNENLAMAIRSKGKSLKGCFEYCQKKISSALGNKNGTLRDREVYNMEIDYYIKGE